MTAHTAKAPKWDAMQEKMISVLSLSVMWYDLLQGGKWSSVIRPDIRVLSFTGRFPTLPPTFLPENCQRIFHWPQPHNSLIIITVALQLIINRFEGMCFSARGLPSGEHSLPCNISVLPLGRNKAWSKKYGKSCACVKSKLSTCLGPGQCFCKISLPLLTLIGKSISYMSFWVQ